MMPSQNLVLHCHLPGPSVFYSSTQRDERGVVTRVEGVDRGGGGAPPPSASWAENTISSEHT
jgi:hypothetical protein